MLILKSATSMVADMRLRDTVHLFIVTLLTSHAALCDEGSPVEFSGVVTFQLLPANVIRINQIIEDPKPGTSYIGDTGILVEVDENPEVMANWTVVTIRYHEYKEPKIISYEILSEQHEITVKYRAVSVEVTGDLSDYISE